MDIQIFNHSSLWLFYLKCDWFQISISKSWFPQHHISFEKTSKHNKVLFRNNFLMEDVQIPLIGIGLEALNQEKLPLSREVLQLYFFLVKLYKNKQSAANSTVAAIISLWRRTGIPFHNTTDVKNKVNKLVNLHASLMKNYKYTGTSQVRKRNEFEISINSLFDISVTRRLNHGTIRAEIISFLNDQRNNRELLIRTIENNSESSEENVYSEDEYNPNGNVVLI